MGKLVKRGLFGTVAIALVVAAAWFGVYYWRTGRFLQSTDDAYVQADYTTIAPKVSGYIDQVLVHDNQPVKAGTVLARIDDRDLRTALAQARSDVDGAQAAIANLDARLVQQQAMVEQAQAQVTEGEAELTFAQQQETRYRDLAHNGAGTVQQSQQAASDLRRKLAALDADRAALLAAEKQIGVLKTQREQAQATLDHDRAVEHQAELNVGYATIRAPIDGTVGARTLRVGQYVQAGTQLMALVPLKAVYVLANFKETQLTHMHAGETVTVDVDTFPGKPLKARINSLAPASGQVFALLPPDNATGNFTKIVQRIPVKITFDPDSPLLGRLRPGMSVTATVDTRGTAASQQVAAR